MLKGTTTRSALDMAEAAERMGGSLGSWTEQMFVDALRTGKHQGTGRDILPPMPWYWYRFMTDDDLKAVYAYLQSLPPINNPIPDPTPPDKVPR